MKAIGVAFVALFVVGLVAEAWPLILLGAGIALAIRLLRTAAQRRLKTHAARRQANEALIARADYEHAMCQQGNPIGIYGQYPPAG